MGDLGTCRFLFANFLSEVASTLHFMRYLVTSHHIWGVNTFSVDPPASLSCNLVLFYNFTGEPSEKKIDQVLAYARVLMHLFDKYLLCAHSRPSDCIANPLNLNPGLSYFQKHSFPNLAQGNSFLLN